MAYRQKWGCVTHTTPQPSGCEVATFGYACRLSLGPPPLISELFGRARPRAAPSGPMLCAVPRLLGQGGEPICARRALAAVSIRAGVVNGGASAQPDQGMVSLRAGVPPPPGVSPKQPARITIKERVANAIELLSRNVTGFRDIFQWVASVVTSISFRAGPYIAPKARIWPNPLMRHANPCRLSCMSHTTYQIVVIQISKLQNARTDPPDWHALRIVASRAPVLCLGI